MGYSTDDLDYTKPKEKIFCNLYIFTKVPWIVMGSYLHARGFQSGLIHFEKAALIRIFREMPYEPPAPKLG